MKLAVNAVAANEDVRTGVGAYAFSVLDGLKNLTGPEDHVTLYSRDPLGAHWGLFNEGWSHQSLAWNYPGWSRFALGRTLKKTPPDVAFFPSSGIAPGAPINSVATVHDIGFVTYPHLYAAGDRRAQMSALNSILKHSKHIISVSEFTKLELTQRFGVDPDRITVTPLGVAEHHFTKALDEKIKAIKQKHRLGNNYILFVSRIDQKKNIKNLIRAFEIFKEGRGVGDPHELILVGPDGAGAEQIRTRAKNSRVHESIQFLGPVTEEEKHTLYSGALLYVNVSWYEGFGLTPLEAGAHGVPSIVSNILAHKEVLGRDALFVDPEHPDQVARAIAELATNPRKREEMAASVHELAKTYRWHKTAAKTWEVLNMVAQQ